MNGVNPNNNKNKFNITQIISHVRRMSKPGVIFILLFSAYIIVNTFNLSYFRIYIYDVETNAEINFACFIGAVIVLFAVIFVLYLLLWRITHFHRYILFFSSVVFAVGLVANNNLDIAYNITVLAILFYIINYCFRGEDGINFEGLDGIMGFKGLIIIISVLVLAYTAVVSHTCILRYRSFWASTFDFGIFAQMFENMAKTGLQITTVERNVPLSHFAVHFSPIYYLILPVYMIFRSPESLLGIQAAAVAAGAFPLALIAKKSGLSGTRALLIVLAYLFYPALTGGLFFDFHEKKFLPVLILWLMYFIISDDSRVLRKYILIYIFAALVLMVKEDSFLYVFCIALYMVSIKKDGKYIKNNILHGAVIAALSVGYFIFAAYYIDAYGLGVMTWRFDLFLRIGEDGFAAMIINVVKSPALFLASLLSVPEKLEFIFYMFIPLCFLPFISQRLNFVILIAPMLILNLATDYIYQYNINFQYTYGITPLLFFLAAQNLSKINIKHITKLCVMMACFSLVLFTSKNFNRFHSYHFVYNNFKDDFIEAAEMIKQIPMDASVSAGNFIAPHLIKREIVYMLEVGAEDYFDYGTDYLVIDMRDVDTATYRSFLREIERYGYVKIDSGVFIEIFKKTDDGGY